MKKIGYASLVFCSMIALSYCNTSKKAVAEAPVKSNYETNVLPLLEIKCAPCHMPAKGGKKLPLDSYESAKTNIDEIITRIERNPGEKGFMPFKKEKLSDSSILVFKQWKSDGLLQK